MPRRRASHVLGGGVNRKALTMTLPYALKGREKTELLWLKGFPISPPVNKLEDEVVSLKC